MKKAAFMITACAAGLLHLYSARAQDVAAGRAAFANCSACHTTDGRPSVGPTLRGIGGRRAGRLPGFRYSRALRRTNIVWNAVTLDAWIAAPQELVPGNLMPFSGLPDAKTRSNLVAYLLSLQ